MFFNLDFCSYLLEATAPIYLIVLFKILKQLKVIAKSISWSPSQLQNSQNNADQVSSWRHYIADTIGYIPVQMSQLRLQAAMTHMQRNYKLTALAFGINIVWSGTALHIHLYLPRTGVETQRDTHTVNCTGIPTAQIITWLLHLLEGVIHLDLHNSSFSTKPHSIIILLLIQCRDHSY